MKPYALYIIKFATHYILKMKTVVKKVIVLFICLLPLSMVAQDTKLEKKGAVSAKVQRKAARQKWKDQRKLERAQKKAVEAHDKRLQTKKTRKRMKQEKKKSDRLRENKREFFLVRWFRYKH